MKRIAVFFVLLNLTFSSLGQESKGIPIKNGIDKPSLLPIHHFGMFSARVNQNFKVRPPDNFTLNFSYASANTFHPFVEMYLPKDPATRAQMSELVWYDRHFFIDQQTTPADYENIVIEAVFKNFRVDTNFKIAKNHELGITLRSYLVIKGKFPFSVFTSDEFIEWFHSNIAGGEDPFGRRYYGLNQVNVRYTDRNGRVMELNNGDFFLGGIELNHYYYPRFKGLLQRIIHFNFGSHLGWNTTSTNPSLDIGLSVNLVKEWRLKNSNELRGAFGSAVLRRNIIDFSDVVQLGNNSYLGSFEGMLEYTKYTRKKNYHSFAVNYQIQSSFMKREERNYYQFVGLWREIHSGWSNGFEKLYESQSAWSFLYTYGRPNLSITLYLKQDLYLNNSPDVQNGISVSVPLLKS